MKSICQSRNKYLQDIKNFNYFRISFHPQKWLGVTKKYSHSSHKGWWSLSVLCCCVTNYHRPRNLKQPRVIVLVTQWWRICLPVQKMQVWSLGREDPLKKEMTTDSCFLAWEIPWTGEPGRLQFMGSQKSWTWLRWLSTHARTHALCSTGNCAQCYVAAWMEGAFGGGWIHVYVWLSPLAVHLKLSQHC